MSAELITGAAKLANGIAEFAIDNSMISNKIISLLKDTLAKNFYNLN